jgi:uncharacterized protein YukE
MEMPGAVTWLLPIVVGESWPEGDEDKLRALRDAWHVASKALSPVSEIGSKAASEVTANWTGDSATAFAEQWKKFVDGDEAYFKSLADAAKALGDSCDQTALDIEYTKYMIIISLVILAAQIAAMLAAAVPSLGTSTAGIAPAQIATRMTVQMLFRELLEKLAQQGFKQLAKELLERFLKQGLKKIAKEVATNVAMNVAMDAGIQGLQIAKGDRKDWDWSKTKDGAIGGAVDGVVGAASGGIGKKMRGEEGFGVAGKAVQGAAEGVASTVGQAAVTGQLGNLSAKDILTGASSGAVSSGVDGAKEHFKSADSPHVNTPDNPGHEPSSQRPGSNEPAAQAPPTADPAPAQHAQPRSEPTPSSPDSAPPHSAPPHSASSHSTASNGADHSPAPDRHTGDSGQGPAPNDRVSQQSAPTVDRNDGGNGQPAHTTPESGQADANRAPAPASQAQAAPATEGGQQGAPQQSNAAPAQSSPSPSSPSPASVGGGNAGHSPAPVATSAAQTPSSAGYGMAPPPGGHGGFGPASGGQNFGPNGPSPTGGRPQDNVSAAAYTQNPGQRPDFGQPVPRQDAPFGGQPGVPGQGGFAPPPPLSPPSGGGQLGGGPSQPRPAGPRQPGQMPPPNQPPRQGPPPPAPPPRQPGHPAPDPRRGNYFQQDPRGGPGPHRPGPGQGAPPGSPQAPRPPQGPPGQRGPVGYPQQPRPPQAYGPGHYPQGPSGPGRPPMPPPGPGRPMPHQGFDPRQPHPGGVPPQVPGPRHGPPLTPGRETPRHGGEPVPAHDGRGSLDEPRPEQHHAGPEPVKHEDAPATTGQPTSERPEMDDAANRGEAYLSDPHHRGSAAEHDSIRQALGSDENYHRMRDTALARRDANPALAHLSDDNATAIHGYSRELSYPINSAHRIGESHPDFEAAQHQNRAIDGALNELPPHVGPLVRGLDFNGDAALAKLAADHYVPGEVTIEPTLTSASMKIHESQKSMFGDDVVLHIDSKTSRDISSLAQNPGEHEALSKAGTQLLVHSKELQMGPAGQRKWVIHAEEVAPGDPRHLDPDTAKQKMAERRERFAREEAEVKQRTKSRLESLLGGPVEPVEHHAPPAHDPSVITNRLDGGYGHDGYHAPGEAPAHTSTGHHDWSPLAQATNPPSEPAIHAGTANSNQQASYIAERHPQLTAVNPDFHDPDAFANGYHTNCTRGVVAYAQRLLGIDAHAEPLLPHEMATKGTLEHVQQQLGGQWQSHPDYDSVIHAMNNEPVGSHAVVGVLYQGPNGQPFGHVAMVVHTSEGVAFIDPQSGSLMHLPHPPLKLDLLPFGSLKDSAGAAAPHEHTHTDTHTGTSTTGHPGHGAAEPETLDTAQAHPGYDVRPSHIGPDGRPVPSVSHTLPADSTATPGEHTPAPHRSYGTADPAGHDDPGQHPDHVDPQAREEAARYLADPRVDEALNRANQPDASGEVPKVDGVPLGDAVRRMLPEHPDLVRVMQSADFLENSLLARPQTMVGLMQHPEAIPILEAAVHDVHHPDPETPPLPPTADPTPLELNQRETSGELATSAGNYRPEDRLQPDFEEHRRHEEGYRAEYMDKLYAKAKVAQAELTRIVDQLAADNDGEAHARKELKKLGRANDKIDADYSGDASRLVDVAGAYIQFDKVKDVYAALAVLAGHPDLEIVKFKDRFAKPTESGYRDLQMSVRMSNGHIAELRLHLKSLDEVTLYEHALYEVRRDLDSAAYDDGDRPLTAEEAGLRDALLARERELFWNALQGGL